MVFTFIQAQTTLLEHLKSPNFMETPSFQYDLSSIDPYLQYTESPYSIPMNRQSNMNNNLSDYSYWSSNATASPARPYTPPDAGISSPMLYNLSSEVMSSDGMQSGRLSCGSGSHFVPFSASVPHSHCFNPITAPATHSKVPPCRRSTKNENSDNDEDSADFQPANNNSGGSTDMRRETIRHQRIESEQRWRDELRDGYRRLKDALPVSNQKSSKVSLLDQG
jgi:hypothetical protein